MKKTCFKWKCELVFNDRRLYAVHLLWVLRYIVCKYFESVSVFFLVFLWHFDQRMTYMFNLIECQDFTNWIGDTDKCVRGNMDMHLAIQTFREFNVRCEFSKAQPTPKLFYWHWTTTFIAQYWLFLGRALSQTNNTTELVWISVYKHCMLHKNMATYIQATVCKY